MERQFTYTLVAEDNFLGHCSSNIYREFSFVGVFL